MHMTYLTFYFIHKTTYYVWNSVLLTKLSHKILLTHILRIIDLNMFENSELYCDESSYVSELAN